MDLVPVDSSMLTAVGYDDGTGELEAVFISGAVWRYADVPREVYEELLSASSIGSYMQDEIIGVYPEYELKRRRRR